jgi:murein DD-endopeptidase MepM/ murein hydrolase activator NlpD
VEGVPLVAARAGRVADVVSNLTVNCYDLGDPPGCPAFGNYVAIEHEDGDASWYMHMQTNSATVAVGQNLARGTQIGLLGTTGRSKGPHVHFHVTPGLSTSSTNPARYQAYDPVYLLSTCFVPQQGNWYTSNNAP